MLQTTMRLSRFAPINKIIHIHRYINRVIHPVLNSIKKNKNKFRQNNQQNNQNVSQIYSCDIARDIDCFIIPRKYKNTDLLYDGCVYTDASIMNKIAGIGIWSDRYELNNSWSLKGHLDINRAELGAILIALLKLNYEGNVHILSDSLTALKLINGSIQLDKFSLIANCVQYMRDNWSGSINFKKVKGHSGNIGNENADRLAHNGVMNHYHHKPLYLPDDIFGKGKINSDILDIKEILNTIKNVNNL